MSFGGFDGPPPRDVIVLLAVISVTFSLGFFTPVLELLRLTPLAWQQGWLWQLATYPWIGTGGASLWILLELLILYWFAADVARSLGRGRFWRLLLYTTLGAAVVAVAVDVASWVLRVDVPTDFQLMQGQRMLIVVVIAAFAVLRQHATILLFFVLPIQARWFLWIEIAFAFIGFLGSKDLAGFLGICTAVGLTVVLLRPGRWRGMLRETRLRLDRWRIQRKLGRRRRKSGLRAVDPPDSPDRWVN